MERGTKISEHVTSYTIEEFAEKEYERFLDIIHRPIFDIESEKYRSSQVLVLNSAKGALLNAIMFEMARIKNKHCE